MIAQAGGATVEIALLEPQKAQQPAPRALNTEETQETEKDFQMFGDDGLTFWDFLDIINPLQHIPVISTLYRSITGDEIDPAAKIAGGTLYGGPIGAASSLIDVAIDFGTGKDLGEHAMALVRGEEPAVETAQNPYIPTQAAQNDAHFRNAAAPSANPYLARAGIAELPVSVSAYAPPAPVLAQDLAQSQGMRCIPVAKQTYAEQIAAYTPAKKGVAAAPDLGLLSDIKHLQQAGIISKEPTAPNSPEPLNLAPKYTAEETAPKKIDPILSKRLKEAEAAYQKLSKTSDSWLTDSIMRGMDSLDKMALPESDGSLDGLAPASKSAPAALSASLY